MGLIIVLTVGIILGWLAAIVIDFDDRIGTPLCALAGGIGALCGAILAGDTSLIAGVSPAQLIWAVLGAAAAIIATNLTSAASNRTGQRKV